MLASQALNTVCGSALDVLLASKSLHKASYVQHFLLEVSCRAPESNKANLANKLGIQDWSIPGV